MNDKNILDKLDNIIELLEERDLREKSKRKVFFQNLLFGIARGFGISIGMIVVSAIFVIIIRKLILLPVIGQYIAKLVAIVENYLNEYKKY